MSVAPLSIDQFKNRFFQEKCIWWFAYDTGPKKTCRGRFKDYDPEMTEEDSLEWSWMQFEHLLDDIPYGKLEVVCKSSEKANRGNAPTYTVAWGDQSLAMPSAGASSAYQRGQNAGMGGTWPMMQFFLQQQDKLNREVQDARQEAMQLRFENQLMAAQIESDNAPSMKEELLREGIGALKSILTAQAMRPTAQLGTMGKRPQNTDSMVDQSDSAAEHGGSYKREFTPDDAYKYMTAITGLFPEFDPHTVLDALYNLGKQNTDMIRIQIQNFVTHVQQ